LLNEREIPFTYREYTVDPLSADELRDVLGKLGLGPRDVLRKRDAKKLGVDAGSLSDDALIAQMVVHPTLLERPIAVLGDRAALGRPAERVLDVVA
jgi:arsenate reductase